VEDISVTYMLLMSRELCIKVVNEIILYDDARSKKQKNPINNLLLCYDVNNEGNRKASF
jgi:hypothetical protein